MQGTTGISSWSGHGHAAGPDRSLDSYDKCIYLETLGLTDDEIRELLKESIESGNIVFSGSPRQSISKHDNKPISLQKEFDLIYAYHRVKTSVLNNMADALRILSRRR